MWKSLKASARRTNTRAICEDTVNAETYIQVLKKDVS